MNLFNIFLGLGITYMCFVELQSALLGSTGVLITGLLVIGAYKDWRGQG